MKDSAHMGSAQMRERIDTYIRAYNAFDVAGMVAQLTPDVVFENYVNGVSNASCEGIAAFQCMAERAALLFSEREQRITGVRVQLDSVLVDIAYRGRLAEDIPGGPAVGAELNLQGQSEFWFDGGLIRRIVDRC